VSLFDGRLRDIIKTMPPRMDVGAGLPLWAAYPDFSRVSFINELMLTIWPYASAAVRHELELMAGSVRDTRYNHRRSRVWLTERSVCVIQRLMCDVCAHHV
jgi:hypothetical protein